MNTELNTPPEIKVIPRRFTVVLTEAQACELVERLKYSKTTIPDLTEPVWKAIEASLGYNVSESPF